MIVLHLLVVSVIIALRAALLLGTRFYERFGDCLARFVERPALRIPTQPDAVRSIQSIK